MIPPLRFFFFGLLFMLSGVGSLIGVKTGQVIGFGTRTKKCATCEAASRAGKRARTHDCRCNWDGSSKSMETDVCAQLVESCEENGEAQMAILVGDDDSSTIKKVRDTLKNGLTLSMQRELLCLLFMVYRNHTKS